MKRAIFAFAIGLVFAVSGQARAATTALYLFDDLINTSSAYLYEDSSGVDDLDFAFPKAPGSFSGSLGFGDRPPPITTGNSLFVNNAAPVLTPVSINGNFSVGTTGQQTVEFWYKGFRSDTTQYILAQDDLNTIGGGNGWDIVQDRPDPSGRYGIRVNYTDSRYTNADGTGGSTEAGHIQGWSTPVNLDLGVWYHVAVSVDSSAGEGRIYINGELITQVIGWNLDTMDFGPKTNAPLVLGSQPQANGFTNQFNIDELRFSDTILLPGNGTGVGELAWNASLALQAQ